MKKLMMFAACAAMTGMVAGCFTSATAYTETKHADGSVTVSRVNVIGTGDKASEIAAEGLFADGAADDLGAGVNTNHACGSKPVASSSFETNANVRVVYVRRLCSCGGEMKPGYYVLTSNPPQYPHVCDRCGRSETYLVCYPEVRYEWAG